jgi:ABC-type Mn2+/Zn2+ transport system permease subunit
MFTKESIENYFLSYKHIHLFLCFVAITAIIVSAIFYWAIKKEYYKGIAIGIVGFAFAFGMYGYANYTKADRLRKINTYNYDLHPEYLKTKELPRIATLKTTITIIGIIHLILLAISLYCSNYYAKKMKYLSGIFTGIFVMCVIALGVCYVLKNKTKAYEEGILEFTKEIRVV